MTKSHKEMPKPLAVILAWTTVFLLGIASFLLTSMLSMTVIGFDEEFSGIDTIRYYVLAGVFGLTLLGAIIAAVWRKRKRAYVKHMLIGLWIGVSIFGLFFFGGAVALIVHLTNINSAQGVAQCSSARQQYEEHASAIVPLLTDSGASGTAFAIDPDGTLMTAYHVVEGAKKIEANFSSGVLPLEVIETSPEYDLALLSMNLETPGYFHLSSNYADLDEVYVYGYPGNALHAGPPSVSEGIVSRVLNTEALRMTESSVPNGLEIVQTDAAINPGNSGGPLIGSCGVIGVVQSVSDSAQLNDYIGIGSEDGIGFAISSKSAAEKFNLSID